MFKLSINSHRASFMEISPQSNLHGIISTSSSPTEVYSTAGLIYPQVAVETFSSNSSLYPPMGSSTWSPSPVDLLADKEVDHSPTCSRNFLNTVYGSSSPFRGLFPQHNSCDLIPQRSLCLQHYKVPDRILFSSRIYSSLLSPEELTLISETWSDKYIGGMFISFIPSQGA